MKTRSIAIALLTTIFGTAAAACDEAVPDATYAAAELQTEQSALTTDEAVTILRLEVKAFAAQVEGFLGDLQEQAAQIAALQAEHPVSTDGIADGAVTTGKLAPDAVAPDALHADTADLATDLAPAVAVRSLNGLTEDVTVLGSGGVSVSTSGGVITVAAAANDGASIVALSQDNLQQVSLASSDIVRVDGTINLTSDYDEMYGLSLTIHGGAFVGTGQQELQLGTGSTVFNTSFKDVHLDGNAVTFVNCEFEGEINFPFGADLFGGHLQSVTQSTMHQVGHLIGVDVDNSAVLRAEGLESCDITNSVLGGTALNSNSIGYLADSRVHDTVVYVRSGNRITGNDFDNSHVRVWGKDSGGNASGLMAISDNHFDNVLGGESEALSIDMSTSSYYSLVVEGNTFIIQSDDPRSVWVGGTPSGGWQYQLVNISGNNFLKGGQAIQYSGSVRLVVDGNVLRATSLGVSDGGNVQLGENFVF